MRLCLNSGLWGPVSGETNAMSWGILKAAWHQMIFNLTIALWMADDMEFGYLKASQAFILRDISDMQKWPVYTVS